MMERRLCLVDSSFREQCKEFLQDEQVCFYLKDLGIFFISASSALPALSSTHGFQFSQHDEGGKSQVSRFGAAASAKKQEARKLSEGMNQAERSQRLQICYHGFPT